MVNIELFSYIQDIWCGSRWPSFRRRNTNDDNNYDRTEVGKYSSFGYGMVIIDIYDFIELRLMWSWIDPDTQENNLGLQITKLWRVADLEWNRVRGLDELEKFGRFFTFVLVTCVGSKRNCYRSWILGDRSFKWLRFRSGNCLRSIWNLRNLGLWDGAEF